MKRTIGYTKFEESAACVEQEIKVQYVGVRSLNDVSDAQSLLDIGG